MENQSDYWNNHAGVTGYKTLLIYYPLNLEIIQTPNKSFFLSCRLGSSCEVASRDFEEIGDCLEILFNLIGESRDA